MHCFAQKIPKNQRLNYFYMKSISRKKGTIFCPFLAHCGIARSKHAAQKWFHIKVGGVKTGRFILHLPPVEVGHNFAALFCKFWHVHFVGQWWNRKVSCESFLIFLINETYCDKSQNLFQLRNTFPVLFHAKIFFVFYQYTSYLSHKIPKQNCFIDILFIFTDIKSFRKVKTTEK